METAIGALPVAYREALLLVLVEGLRPAEAAGVCGISPEAMRQRLSRARTAQAATLEVDGVLYLSAFVLDVLRLL
jgi:RNA polymerase sigma-70 factor, ECF subfamily